MKTSMLLRSRQAVFFKTVVLFVIWLILSGPGHPFHVGLGLVVSFGVAWLNAGRADARFHAVFLLRMLWYLPWLFGRIVQSGLHMTAIILRPSLPIAPRLIRYRTGLQNQTAVVLLGNSITLTPGTITAEVNADELVVHTIDDEAGHDLTTQRFERRIDRLFPANKGVA